MEGEVFRLAQMSTALLSARNHADRPRRPAEMDFAPQCLNIAKLKRKMDISGLTLQIAAENVFESGRFYMLWRNGNFIVIQAEPWWRPGYDPHHTLPMGCFLEEHRALWHLQEVIQIMLDSIVIDGESNWAYLVRLKGGSYRLVYKKRQLVHDCSIWTKVVELDDIELTRFATGLCWEGIHEGKDVDIFIAWQDHWGPYISAESRGQKLVQSRGVGHYFFDLEAHVSKNGVIIGIMMEPPVGRGVTSADRSAVFEAVADIQQHGVFFLFEAYDIYITERGVRFASASSAKYYQDRDALARDAEPIWGALAEIFCDTGDDPSTGCIVGFRSMSSSAVVIPRLPSPARPIALTAEGVKIRWVWSIMTSDVFCHSGGCAFSQLQTLYRRAEHAVTRRGKSIKDDRRALLPPDDASGDSGTFVARLGSLDGPLVTTHTPATRYHPYARSSKRLPLPQEPDQTLLWS